MLYFLFEAILPLHGLFLSSLPILIPMLQFKTKTGRIILSAKLAEVFLSTVLCKIHIQNCSIRAQNHKQLPNQLKLIYSRLTGLLPISEKIPIISCNGWKYFYHGYVKHKDIFMSEKTTIKTTAIKHSSSKCGYSRLWTVVLRADLLKATKHCGTFL